MYKIYLSNNKILFKDNLDDIFIDSTIKKDIKTSNEGLSVLKIEINKLVNKDLILDLDNSNLDLYLDFNECYFCSFKICCNLHRHIIINFKHCNIENLNINNIHYNLKIKDCIINNLILEDSIKEPIEFSLINNKINSFTLKNIELKNEDLTLPFNSGDCSVEPVNFDTIFQNIEFDNVRNLKNLYISESVNNKIIIKNCLELSEMTLNHLPLIKVLEIKNLPELMNLEIDVIKNIKNLILKEEDLPKLYKLWLFRCDMNSLEISRNIKKILLEECNLLKQKIIKRKRIYRICETKKEKNEIQKERTSKCYKCNKFIDNNLKINLREYKISSIGEEPIKFSYYSCC